MSKSSATRVTFRRRFGLLTLYCFRCRLFFVILLMGVSSQAHQLCVNTKVWSVQVVGDFYLPKLWGHHAYLTIEKESELLVGFGYWGKVGFNNEQNLPVSQSRKQSLSPEKVVDEEKFCQKIDKNQIEQILAEARAYPENQGSYGNYLNNCMSFARHIYEMYTGDEIPLLFNSPYLLHQLLENANLTERDKLVP